MAENFKYYKVTPLDGDVVTNKCIQVVHYCCVDENNQVYLKNGATLNFDTYKNKICGETTTFEEVPKLIVINNKKRYILDQINTLRERMKQADYEQPKELVLIGDYVKPFNKSRK